MTVRGGRRGRHGWRAMVAILLRRRLTPGNAEAGYRPLADAPGTYVRAD